MRKYDAISIPVGITYKGEREFNTFLGGCLTLLIALYISIQCISMIVKGHTNPDYESQKNEFWGDVEELPPVNFDTDLTSIAVRLN